MAKKPTFDDVANVEKRDGGVIVVKPKDKRLLDEARISALGFGIMELIKDAKPEGVKKRTLVLDMSEVEYMSTKALAAMLYTNVELGTHGDNRLAIAGASQPILETLVITRLMDKFTIAASVDEAIKSSRSVSTGPAR